MSGGTKMLLTDVAGVVFLVLLSLPPASMGCNGEGCSPFPPRTSAPDGQEKGVRGERLSRRMNEVSNEASKQVKLVSW